MRHAALLFFIAGCATGGGSTATRVITDQAVVQGELAAVGVEMMRRHEAVTDEVSLPRDTVLQLLPGVLGDLQFVIEGSDQKAGTLTTRSSRFRGSLGGARLSTYFSCGESAMGRTADRYSVIVKVTMEVQPVGDHQSRLSTVAAGSARHDDNGGTAVICQSTGALERRIRTSLMAASLRSP
ncbi:MAG: hypothetical protein IT361_09830 [Gemmatimonadaceae bacterium]|nr:hypothetical protein [Gemmatimonadaceae bacterium]